MDLQLDGKSALVTGSTAGIGFAIAESLARERCRVIVNGRTQARVDAALKKLPGAVGMAADLGTSGGVEEAIKRFPGCRYSGQQHGHLRAQGFRVNSRR